ncbi:hypothetical protein EVB32_329 [Rhizobium phage RHph_TM39]|uniref:Uncharacterized protein n=2 Tax=Cuauhnahuacvirus TaxID=3044696 RepID=A0A7S5R869_9CAUD|nr:hypothetical protein PQC16_gp308 [Rhizobium phage RHph_TM30]YP_010671481.1 hypothetical protein PQC17_gp309 [Rhizobium phage RHph_Y65]QIG71804.1 hypothetical protein EVB94_353 [Rhizobium phage RHph_TM40]QIG72164.1 hypothetical protein EVB95_351 [Rhizobium phage RHph_TM2_3B]QIG72527.1 hypothetical protein EVB96_351 [Rhizobium phage RHph_TM3_3_6]QIG77297.1 hypothetical protein EVB32_329 [Rhizobium phage RHph_TM39]QIG77915.1 hypothetical protein EVB64_349 [Rhizobium phage RHph_TM61]
MPLSVPPFVGITAENNNSSSRVATTEFVNTVVTDKINTIKGSAPASRDTLAELSTAIDANSVSDTSTAIAMAIALG